MDFFKKSDVDEYNDLLREYNDLLREVGRLRVEVAAERAAVVAWLLEQIGLPGLSMDEKSLLVHASRRIERGEHRREGGE